MNTESNRALDWNHGVLSVQSLGGMLGPTLFVLSDGRQVAPFQVAPWGNEAGGEEMPGILRRLRGEWPCVPFGADADREAGDGWPRSTAQPTVDPFPHGFSSNHDWQFQAPSPTEIALVIEYPRSHPVHSLERHIVPDPDAAAIDFELVINIRADCEMPLGLHPCFRLPQAPGAMRIEVDQGVTGATFPLDVDASSIFEPGQFTPDWRKVRLRDGSTLDVSRAPLEQNTEELVQLLDMPGHAALWNAAEGYRARLSWDREHFPSALLWFSNRGRTFPPWSGRHLALGLEPICSAFDLGAQISTADNPIRRRGVPTSRAFKAGERFMTRYRVEVESAPIA